MTKVALTKSRPTGYSNGAQEESRKGRDYCARPFWFKAGCLELLALALEADG